MKDKELRLSRFTFAALCSGLALDSPSAHAQTTTRTLQVGAETRTYDIRIPSGTSLAGRALVLVFHGAGGTGTRIAAHTGFDRVADRAGFVAVFPDGIGRRWNDGRRGLSSNKDVAFVRALLDTLRRQFRIDSTRVFATGISNGAMFAHRLACDMPGAFAAIAPVAGAMPASLPATCRSSPVSMIALQGTLDRLVPFEGGDVGARGAVLSARATAAHWARAAGCRMEPVAESMPDRVRDGTRIQRIIYQGCGARAVELHAIIGGGHTWPGAPGGSSTLIGRTTREIDASELIWEFFRRHPRR